MHIRREIVEQRKEKVDKRQLRLLISARDTHKVQKHKIAFNPNKKQFSLF